ncbi:sodium-coupled monocarboxylate transporter 2-like [Asterias rubens]|uniref:sodium-coupled monocarboxylate transporter 2-like n=1 Tax=Asterias rubens TaxID=7604 RepID=UPI0014555248|nr:sodium-coupled monocarboxylate transporter 2-like [Asterias rubens]
MDVGRAVFSWADYVVLSVVLSLSSFIGIFYAVRARNRGTTSEFMVANKQMGFFPVAMSLLASLFTGIFIQGTVSEVYFRGAVVPFCGVIPLMCSAYIGGRIFLPTFYKLEIKSVYQYLEMRFNVSVRNCCLIIGYVFMILHCGIATFAASIVLTTVSDLSFFASVMILSGVCTFYTAVGGIKAVLWADCFQMFLIFSPVVGAVVISSSTIGLGRVWEIGEEGGRLDLFNFSFDPTEYMTFWTALFGNLLGWMPSQCILQYQVQRYITCKDIKTANIAYSFYTFGCFLVVVFCGLAGLCVYAQYVDCDPFTQGLITFRDEMLPYFALDTFHIYPGVPGLLVSGLCSAALSTVSSVINSIVTISGEHIITKIWKDVPDSRYLLITKLLAVFFGVLNVGVTYLMSILGDIMPALIGLIGGTNGPVMGVFILGFMFPRCNSKGALVGFICGITLGMWIFIGSVVYQETPPTLPLSVEGCLVETVTNDTISAAFGYNMTTSPGTTDVGYITSNPTMGLYTNVTDGLNTTVVEPDNGG